MLIAHLPAAFLATRAVASRPATLTAGLIGGFFPDLDMLWFLAGGGRVHHHAYPTHWPAAWLALLALAAPLPRGARGPAVAFAANGLLHLLLDTVAGDVRWLAPLSTAAFSLVTVPASHGHWILSFMAHWTFALEVSLVAVGCYVFVRTQAWRNWQTRRI